MNSVSVNPVYLDTPFNSKANYAAPVDSKAAGGCFKDTWTLTDVEWIDLIGTKWILRSNRCPFEEGSDLLDELKGAVW